jgi:PadR family transcriptional regulator PadR
LNKGLVVSRDLAKKDIPTLILAVLSEGPCHGYAIAREAERRSKDVFRLREGSLYPALRVLEQDGLIEGGWEVQSSGPARKVYAITAAGRAELTKRAQEWLAYREAIEAFIGGKTHAQRA